MESPLMNGFWWKKIKGCLSLLLSTHQLSRQIEKSLCDYITIFLLSLLINQPGLV